MVEGQDPSFCQVEICYLLQNLTFEKFAFSGHFEHETLANLHCSLEIEELKRKLVQNLCFITQKLGPEPNYDAELKISKLAGF